MMLPPLLSSRSLSFAVPLFCLGALLTLSACGNKGASAQDILGVSRTGPDAFNVVARPPLTVPPDFGLRPPAVAGTPGPGETNTEATARGLLTGTDGEDDALTLAGGKAPAAVIGVKSSGLGTPGERSLLERLGGRSGDDAIRQQLERDAQQKVDDTSWYDGVVPSLHKKKDDTLDPVEETTRLRDDDKKDVVQAPPAELLPASGKASPDYQPNVAKGADAKKAAAKGDFGVGLAPGRQ